MSTSIIGRARKAGYLEFVPHDLRRWTHDNHNTTDDEPYGGGAGQLMKVEPVFEALDELVGGSAANHCEWSSAKHCDGSPAELPAQFPHVIFFSPVGETFTQAIAEDLAQRQHLIMVCGRYEGFDERVYTRADLCLSLGDYVITGGELAAMVVSDAVCRLLPGVLGDELSSIDESFSTGLLEYPQYTRPAVYRGMAVPQVLLSGHHQKIAQWRREQSIIRTARLRPDMLAKVALSASEKELAVAHMCEHANVTMLTEAQMCENAIEGG